MLGKGGPGSLLNKTTRRRNKLWVLLNPKGQLLQAQMTGSRHRVTWTPSCEQERYQLRICRVLLFNDMDQVGVLQGPIRSVEEPLPPTDPRMRGRKGYNLVRGGCTCPKGPVINIYRMTQGILGTHPRTLSSNKRTPGTTQL